MTPAGRHAALIAAWQARLDLAQAATPGPWKVRYASMGVRPHVGTPAGQSVYAWVHRPDGAAVVERHNGGTIEDCEHIAAWSPAAAIVVCQAMLTLLNQHQVGLIAAADGNSSQPICLGCGCDHAPWDLEPWPCPVVEQVIAALGDNQPAEVN